MMVQKLSLPWDDNKAITISKHIPSQDSSLLETFLHLYIIDILEERTCKIAYVYLATFI